MPRLSALQKYMVWYGSDNFEKKNVHVSFHQNCPHTPSVNTDIKSECICLFILVGASMNHNKTCLSKRSDYIHVGVPTSEKLITRPTAPVILHAWSDNLLRVLKHESHVQDKSLSVPPQHWEFICVPPQQCNDAYNNHSIHHWLHN